jgi:hypothetical protein
MAKLVAIGDSLTQGFQSLAITHTRLSYPALIAERMQLGPEEFRVPDFMGAGGLPCSIEWLSRRLEDAYGADLNAFEWLGALHRIPSLLEEVEDYWERGRGSRPIADVDYHNLAVWGFEVADSYQISAGLCREALSAGGAADDLVGLPSEPRLRTGYRVLNPSQRDTRHADTQLGIARRIKDRDGRIQHLIVALGANNCLGTVVDLAVRETPAESPGPNSDYTLWSTAAFDQDYETLATHVQAIGAENTYLATIPHVTIPPITRGVMENCGALPRDRTYFDFYTRFFIRDKDFDRDRDPHLTGEEAAYIDARIDHYNATIRRVAKECGFIVVDMCKLLDDLAVRRRHGNVAPLPPAISDLSVRFFEIQPNGRLQNGGLISLDGVHPTACGYGLVAQLFIDAMKPFDATVRDIDFGRLRSWDALVSRPPRTLNDVFGALNLLERHFHLSRWLSKGALRKR